MRNSLKLYNAMVNLIHVEEYLVYPETSKSHKAMEPLAKKALPSEATTSRSTGLEGSTAQEFRELAMQHRLLPRGMLEGDLHPKKKARSD